jgi:uncharacterized protein DUF5666
MNRTRLGVMIGTMVVMLAAVSVQRTWADDETGDVQVKIQAPLDAVDCSATPPTIQVLGLTIDISMALIDAGSGDSQGDSGGGDSGGDGGDAQGDTGSSGGSCADLMMGQAVEVLLASDSTPLVATEVNQDDEGDVAVQGPIQMVSGSTITVLGLTIDISQATLDGSDDNSEDGMSQPVDPSQLMPGQIVEVQLASNQPPLTATALDVKNFANQVEVEVDDENGEVDDSGDDMDVEVADTVMVQNPSASGPQRVRTVEHFHTSSSGGIIALTGLPSGHAKIVVTRVRNGAMSMGRRSVAVKGNTTRSVRVHLHAMPSN